MERNGSPFYFSIYTYNLGNYISSRFIHPHEDRTIIISKPDFTYSHTYNSDGFRDVSHPIRKADGEFRIVALGDSFTEGVGAPQDSTWPFLLEKGLRQGKSSRLTVFNGGENGSDPVQAYGVLKEKLLCYKPDLVIVCINNSDINEIVCRGGMERLGNPFYKPPDAPSWEMLYGSSFIFRHAANVVGYDWSLKTPLQRLASSKRAQKDIYDCIMAFARLGREKNFRLAVVFHPMNYEFEKGEWEFDDLIQKISVNKDIYAINLLDYYLKAKGKSKQSINDLYWPIDYHHKPAGYRLFTQGVAESLIQKGLIPVDRQVL